MAPVEHTPPDPSRATVHGSPGARPRVAGLMVAALPLLCAMGLFGYLVRAAVPYPALAPPAVAVLAFVLAGAFAWSLVTTRRRLGAFLKGARGEEDVARALAVLPAGHHVFHGLAPQTPAAGATGDIDHVVVGPTGVFAIETKKWQGRITVDAGRVLYDGRVPTRPPLDQARSSARALADWLGPVVDGPVPVQAVVCFAGSDLPPGGIRSGDVVVCDDRALVPLITGDTGNALPESVGETIARHLTLRSRADDPSVA